MKHFIQMSSQEMKKTQGGFIFALIFGLFIFAGGAAGVAAAVGNNKK